jgi:hypothetical protein
MSLYNWLLANKTKEQIAKELVHLAHENAALKDRAGAAETELFWMKVKERNDAQRS